MVAGYGVEVRGGCGKNFADRRLIERRDNPFAVRLARRCWVDLVAAHYEDTTAR